MLRKLIKNKKAQNTAEYAILISLVVAGIIAMQTYAQRALQARVRDASVYLSNETSGLGTTSQYEPYYLESNYVIGSGSNETQLLSSELTGVQKKVDSDRTRESGGYQVSRYTYATGE